MNSLYAYQEKSRRPIVILAFIVSIAMLAVAVFYAAPWFFYIPVLSASILLAWMLYVNRVSGCELNSDHITFYAGAWRKTVQVAEIKTINVTAWMEGAPTVSLTLKHGKTESIPGYCLGSAEELAAALSKLGVPVIKK